MRRALAPILFDDDHKAKTEAARPSPVAPAMRSKSAVRKALTKRTEDDIPVQSFPSLLDDLATITKNRIQPRVEGAKSFDRITVPTRIQDRALQLLGASL